ncbi:hypothetical protein MRB53_001836 [Persea americana]|uniref:Uncharacterized protein n=1 Tax=Persea americana TaxID=3435 RepID=A0ACC2MTH2_PERAE|nr:hypothetical protein MRB53_001836 [Persea americana]
MAVFMRTKRVTDPLDDRVKACLCGEDCRKTGYISSSGSEHKAEDSTFLSDLVDGFLQDDPGSLETEKSSDDSDGEGSGLDPTDSLKDVLLNPTAADDSFREKLLSRVSKAVDEYSGSGLRSDRSALRRAVMASLRDSGYNAGICKTRWESSGRVVGGKYEFVDAVRKSGKGESQGLRYLIEVDFAAEFEIARPTARYSRVVEVLPRIFVGPPEDLKRVVRIVSEEMKRSLRSRDLHLPPWRKSHYMQAKWLGPYRRTVGQVQAKVSASFEGEMIAARCRSVGFHASFVLPSDTLTS